MDSPEIQALRQEANRRVELALKEFYEELRRRRENPLTTLLRTMQEEETDAANQEPGAVCPGVQPEGERVLQ